MGIVGTDLELKWEGDRVTRDVGALLGVGHFEFKLFLAGLAHDSSSLDHWIVLALLVF